VVLAAMVLGETISFLRIIGGMMIILAVIILARSEAPTNERTKNTNGSESIE
jgi:drug/metabolite transporter (DMT)-like permease